MSGERGRFLLGTSSGIVDSFHTSGGGCWGVGGEEAQMDNDSLEETQMDNDSLDCGRYGIVCKRCLMVAVPALVVGSVLGCSGKFSDCLWGASDVTKT